ncbi:flagellar basal-body rod protein FlgF [Seohaeicola zhoushanensis]|uniref:Flagellar basal-body rod protein FlgF n=1 Tax=Seohaeicola zhoushanensis TaxID=1569283 RepID=A0A8J3GU91_9RHOB|nr:flagellar basal-body rod protein FlgF [Seohaeicola zhoushanensis]GHF36237.1 flagellar basal-body rod protein FlgF [Seohaeicola zhoushanensis]
MDNSTYVALSLAQSMRRDLDVTANNIANANTAGFKGEHIVFESYLHKGGAENAETEISFVAETGSFTDDSQGALSQTGNALDVALLGKGWLSYRTEDNQIAYGRDGRFTVDTDGALVTLSGARVLDTGGGEISIPPGAGDIEIARDGTISSSIAGPIARIGVFDLPDLQALNRLGNGMLVRPPGTGTGLQVPAERTEVVQGSIESSNVQPVTEMTRLMEIQRSYERAINLMNGSDELRRDTLQRLGRLG